MEQCKCHHSFQGCELLKPAAININFVLKSIKKLGFPHPTPLWELFMALYQNKEVRRASKNHCTAFASRFMQNAFVCARMQFKGKFCDSIRAVELVYMVKRIPVFLLTFLQFWISLGKREVERQEEEMTAGLAEGVGSKVMLVF